MSFISKVPELSKKMGVHGAVLANKHIYGEPKYEHGASKREFKDKVNHKKADIPGVYPRKRLEMAAGSVAKIRKDQY